MQKKIIALAVAAALTAPAMAFAEAKVYGLIDMSGNVTKSGTTGVGSSAPAYRLVSNKSRLGFKGTDSLSSDLTLTWQMEGVIAMDTGTTGAANNGTVDSTTLFNRDTFIGVSSTSMGSMVVGRKNTPYKISTRKLDVFAANISADNRGLHGAGMMGSLGGNNLALDQRSSNLITYTSPNFSGFSIAAASVFGAETLPRPAPPAANKKGTVMTLAAMYDQGPIYATLAIFNSKAGSAATGDLAAGTSGPLASLLVDDKVTATKLGFGYNKDEIMVGLIFEKPKVEFALGGERSSTNISISSKYKVGEMNAVKAAYTKRGTTKGTGVLPEDGASQIAIGYDHGMNKATTVYALYAKVSQKFVAPTAAPTALQLAAAADPSTISVGIRHSF